MIAHALRAARVGALFAAIMAAIAGGAMAVPGFVTWPWALAFVAAACAGGAVIFGFIGLIVTVLYLKPVGWTFLYSVLGALAAFASTYLLLPYIGEEGQEATGYGMETVTLFASTIVALVAGAAVGMRLKNA